jgi:hypothetical protein
VEDHKFNTGQDKNASQNNGATSFDRQSMYAANQTRMGRNDIHNTTRQRQAIRIFGGLRRFPHRGYWGTVSNYSTRSVIEHVTLTNMTSFVEAMLLFGLSTTLSAEEDDQLAPIRKPCYAALGLANDYFSFDREYAEFQASGQSTTLINSVWLHMQWHHVDSDTAKEMTRQATKRYEEQFLEKCAEYRREHAPLKERLDRYLRALAHQVSGNVVWSLNCPRYHPEYRYEVEESIKDPSRTELAEDSSPRASFEREEGGEESDSDEHSRRSSTSISTSNTTPSSTSSSSRPETAFEPPSPK